MMIAQSTAHFLEFSGKVEQLHKINNGVVNLKPGRQLGNLSSLRCHARRISQARQ